MNRIKVKNNPMDYAIWLNIENKYIMKYKQHYNTFEQEFISDLFKTNRLLITVEDKPIKDYNHYKNLVDTKEISDEENHQLKRIFKWIWAREIPDYSEIGKLIEEREL